MPISRPAPGRVIAGFLVTEVREVPELRSLAVQATHVRTGLRVLHLFNDDTENLFAIAFRTFPIDNTGAAHILEHAVLGGSERFPVRDPFLEMLKSSMATFINAMTYNDRTVYPVASNVKADFFNLVMVYLDAVFHPCITPMTLAQEGHHLAVEKANDGVCSLRIKGIVYSEMMGALSDPDTLIESLQNRLLLPDTPYRYETGGLPECIPELSYADFLSFYDANYSVGNARVFLYGDIPTEEQFLFLDDQLMRVGPGNPAGFHVPYQTPWREPRRVRIQVPIAFDEAPSENGTVTLSWGLGPASDIFEDLIMEVVDRLLLGDAAGPLRRALIESRLGDDLSSSGYDSENWISTFHIGLRGMDAATADAMETIVMETLRSIADNGFPDERIRSVLRQLRFDHCEIQESYPVALMEDVFNAWLYDRDPLFFVDLGHSLVELGQRWEADPGIFSRAVREKLLDNPHRLMLVAVPIVGLAERAEEKRECEMAFRWENFSEEERAEIEKQTRQLEEAQNAPNSAAALAALPKLRKDQVPPVPLCINTDVHTLSSGCTLLHNHIPTNGIDYVALAYDLTGLPETLLDLVPVYADLVGKLGSTSCDYVRLAERITDVTGGLGASASIGIRVVDGVPRLFLITSVKSLEETFHDAWDTLLEVTHQPDFRDRRRLRDVLQQRKAAFHSSLNPNGHIYAMLQAGRHASPLSHVAWRWRGLPQVHFSQAVIEEGNKGLYGIVEHLEALRDFLSIKGPSVVSCTGGTMLADSVSKRISAAWHQTDVSRYGGSEEGFPGHLCLGGPVFEGVSINSDVAFCAASVPTVAANDWRSIPLQVAAQLLSYDYLWEEIRVKGGAYGAMCRYDASLGTLGMASYRDPSPEATMNTFLRLSDYLDKTHWTDETISRAVIACAKGDHVPVRPQEGTMASLWRFICGITDDWRAGRRRQLLETDADTVREVLREVLESTPGEIGRCVLAPERQVRKIAESGEPGYVQLSALYTDDQYEE